MVNAPDSPPREADRLIYAGLLGLSAAGVLQLIDKEVLDIPLLSAAYCFAAALPLLAVGLITDYARRAGTDVPRWREGIGLLGPIVAIAGLGALTLHFGGGVCAVFVAGCIISFILVRSL